MQQLTRVKVLRVLYISGSNSRCHNVVCHRRAIFGTLAAHKPSISPWSESRTYPWSPCHCPGRLKVYLEWRTALVYYLYNILYYRQICIDMHQLVDLSVYSLYLTVPMLQNRRNPPHGPSLVWLHDPRQPYTIARSHRQRTHGSILWN